MKQQLDRINQRITAATADKSQVASYSISDNSVQAELRLYAKWKISVSVDTINYPKDLNPEHPRADLWQQMYDLAIAIRKTATLADRRNPEGYKDHTIKINARTKNAEAKRADAKAAWQIDVGRQFLADYREVTKKSNLARVRKQIIALQAQQKALLPRLRESNSVYLSARKIQTATQSRKNAEALKSGRFWEADNETLKNYFHPPFNRNYLVDVSPRWRAALYTEMDSTAWKAGSGDWRHKNIGTGQAYLCGIDDNGDEWGHRINLSEYIDLDEYGDMGYAGITVEDAMAELFDIRKNKLDACIRQGDLLFCMEKIEQGTEIHPHEGPWQIRESHEILSSGLQHNGTYFASQNPIYIRHTSHNMITLPAGEYRLYELQIADD